MKLFKFKIIIFYLFAAVIYIAPIYFFVEYTGQTWRLDSDYDSVQSIWQYATDYAREHHYFPKYMPYAGVEMPLRSDPTFGLFNPLILAPLLLFNFKHGLWFSYLLLTFLSGICMYRFLKAHKITRLLSLSGGLIYAYSGAFAARIAAGHISYTLTYFLWPLLWHLISIRKISFKINFFLGVVLSLFIISGDVYSTIYSVGFLTIIVLGQILFKQKKLSKIAIQVFQTIIITIVFISPRIYYAIIDLDLLLNLNRFYQSTFGQGSIQLFLTPLPLLIPFRVFFYDRPFFQKYLGFHFNWYEYYAFIAPSLLFFLIYLKKIKNHFFPITILLIIAGLLFAAQKYPYSPFYWLLKDGHLSTYFRVPQRIYLPLTSLVIFIAMLATNSALQNYNTTLKKAVIIMVVAISVCWTFLNNLQTIMFAFEPARSIEKNLVHNLRKKDPKNYFVISLICCSQSYLVEEKISVLNFYAGTQSIKTPSFINPNNLNYDLNKLLIFRPKYIIAPSTFDFSQYNYQPFYANTAGQIWKTSFYNLEPITAAD